MRYDISRQSYRHELALTIMWVENRPYRDARRIADESIDSIVRLRMQ